MNYSEFDVEDFLKDENFVLWVTHPTEDRSFFWNTWISNHPHKVKTLLTAKELISLVELKHKHLPTELEFLSTLENVMKTGNRKSAEAKERRLSTIKKLVIGWSVAASILIGLFIGKNAITEELFPDSAASETNIPTVSKTTLPGQKLTKHVLPDGTIISLNAASKISYPEKFANDRREVFLEGEAFFDVKRDEKRPFLINAQGSITKVLGTSFNINAYPEENNVEIAVLTGKVAVFPWPQNDFSLEDEEMLLLSPNEKATLKPKSHQVSKSGADIATISSWKENLLIFNNESFDAVVKKLERWYGVNFIIDTRTPPIGKWNGRFQGNSLEYVLKGLMFSSDLQFTIEKTKVYVTNNK